MLAQHSQSKPQVLYQLFLRSPAPHLARDLLDQADIAEFAQGVHTRFVRRFAACDTVADGLVEMAADFGVEFFLFALSPEFHAYAPSGGLRYCVDGKVV